MEGYTRYRYAQSLLEAGQPAEAARLLETILTAEASADAVAEPASTAGLSLLARAYFASAQLHRAESTLRLLLALDPVDAYAHHVLGRTLQRLSRHTDAGPHLRLAPGCSTCCTRAPATKSPQGCWRGSSAGTAWSPLFSPPG